MIGNKEIIVVSGLPRSGTSLMMQMLKSGGIDVMTDDVRTADPDNPRGYFEFEAVKEIQQDATWLIEARGKAVKMISMLLYQLPPTETYRILFMERDLEEVLKSQETMLRRLNRPAAPHVQMLESYKIHLDHLDNWLNDRTDMTVLKIGYKELVQQPQSQAQRVCEFLGVSLDLGKMSQSVDPSLYRNRTPAG